MGRIKIAESSLKQIIKKTILEISDPRDPGFDPDAEPEEISLEDFEKMHWNPSSEEESEGLEEITSDPYSDENMDPTDDQYYRSDPYNR
jgi:hypothetical protein